MPDVVDADIYHDHVWLVSQHILVQPSFQIWHFVSADTSPDDFDAGGRARFFNRLPEQSHVPFLARTLLRDGVTQKHDRLTIFQLCRRAGPGKQSRHRQNCPCPEHVRKSPEAAKPRYPQKTPETQRLAERGSSVKRLTNLTCVWVQSPISADFACRAGLRGLPRPAMREASTVSGGKLLPCLAPPSLLRRP